ncbi:MAG: hypothetical protein IJO46_07985, partial [Thermoguttaceae bacterium]|nr:hypothetical protein [Thermoguttaceae bacterium]
KRKGKRFSRRSPRRAKRTDGDSAKIGELKRVGVRRGVRRKNALKSFRRFLPIQRFHFYVLAAAVKRG